ncbi:MAG: DctP family TRAP transporter solute-binding subunit [Pseudomonadota bacterium]
MFTSRKLACAAAVVAGTFALWAAGPAAAQERTIRASLVLSKDHSLGIGLNHMAQCVAQKSGGKLKMQNFFDGALGNDQAVVQQVRTGSVDMVVTATSYMATIVPQAGVFDLPFLFANEQEADAALDGKAGALLAQKLEPAGIVTLSYWENGFRNMTNSRRPINRMEDLQGLKMRALPTPVMLATFKALGGFAIPMPFPELYSALETKTVDGQENPTNLIESVKFYEVQKYLSITRHLYNPVAVMFSKRTFDTLPAADQATLRDCAKTSAIEQRKVNRQQVEQATNRLKEKGMVVNVVSEAEIQRMRQATASVTEAQWAPLGADMKAALEDDLRRARAR